MAHIHFAEQTFAVDTAEQIEEAKKFIAKYQDSGLSKYKVYVGEGQDEVDTGRVVWVDSATDVEAVES